MEHGFQKSFWQRPEGKVGALFAALLGGAAIWGLSLALPFLLTLTANILALGLIGLALAALLYMILDDKLRTLVFYVYRMAMRGLTGFFIKIDPISILKTYKERIGKKLAEMEKSLAALYAELTKLRKKIKQNNDELERAVALAKEADRQQQKIAYGEQLERVGLLRQSNERLSPLEKQISEAFQTVKKLFEISQSKARNIDFRIDHAESELGAARGARNVLRGAMSILRGSEDDQIADQTFDAIENECAMSLAELETFMDASSTIINSYDLEKGVMQQNGLKLIDEWNKKADVLLGAEGLQTDGESNMAQKTLGNSYNQLLQ